MLSTAYRQQQAIPGAADDFIVFEEVVATMDAVMARGFFAITLWRESTGAREGKAAGRHGGVAAAVQR